MKRRWKNKRGELFTEVLFAVAIIGIFAGLMFQSLLLTRQLVQKATNIDTYMAGAQQTADTIGTALWGKNLSNDDLDASSFVLSQQAYERLDGVSGAQHVTQFSYDEDNTRQYTISPKIETVTEYTFSGGRYTERETTIITGFVVWVRFYYSSGENDYVEAFLFSNARGGDIDAL